MADEQVIVTKFTADLSDLEKGVSDYEKTLNDARGASDSLDKSTKNLGATTGDLAAKMRVTANEAAKTAQSTAQIGSEAAKADGPLRRMVTSIANFGRGARDGFRGAIKEVGGFRGVVSQLGAGVKGSLATVGNGFKAISGSIAQVGSQIPIIGGLASALGPVGIAAAAVAGGILAIAKNTDAGATAIDGFSRGAGLAFDRITGLATGLATRLADTFQNAETSTGKAFDVIVKGAERVFQTEFPTLALLKDFFSADIAEGQRLAEQFDRLQDLQSELNLQIAQNEVPLRKNLAALRDTTKSAEERLAIADNITRIEEQNLALRKQALRTELDIVGAQIDQQVARKGEADDALRFRFNELRANLAQAEAESVSITERVAVRRAQIVEQEEARKKAARDKALEAQRKAEAEALKLAEDRAKAEDAINKIIQGVGFDAAQATRTEAEQELAVIRKKYADIEAEASRHFEKLRELSPANDASGIAAREAQALIAIDQARNAEIEKSTKARLDAEAELRAERLKLIGDASKTELQLEQDGINARFDQLEAYAREYITTEEELTAALDILTKERARLLYETEKAGNEKTLAERRASLNASVELFGNALNTIQQLQDASFDRRIQATEQREAELQRAIESARSEEEKNRLESELKATQQQKEQLAKRQKQQQAFAIAATLINTYQAAQAAYLAEVSIPGPGANLRGAIAAALAIAAGLLNVSQIKSAIPGAYEGEEYIDGKQTFKGKDGHLRRVHTGERIVTADQNKKHWDALDAIHNDRFQDYIDAVHIAPIISALGNRDDARIAAFNDSDTGQRIAASVMLAKFYDANIVGELKAQRKEARQQSDLLAALVRNTRPVSRRYW